MDHENNNYSLSTFFNNIKLIYVFTATKQQVVNLAHTTSITKAYENIDDKN